MAQKGVSHFSVPSARGQGQGRGISFERFHDSGSTWEVRGSLAVEVEALNDKPLANTYIRLCTETTYYMSTTSKDTWFAYLSRLSRDSRPSGTYVCTSTVCCSDRCTTRRWQSIIPPSLTSSLTSDDVSIPVEIAIATCRNWVGRKPDIRHFRFHKPVFESKSLIDLNELFMYLLWHLRAGVLNVPIFMGVKIFIINCNKIKMTLY